MLMDYSKISMPELVQQRCLVEPTTSLWLVEGSGQSSPRIRLVKERRKDGHKTWIDNER